jgi:hypothetical protein
MPKRGIERRTMDACLLHSVWISIFEPGLSLFPVRNQVDQLEV